MKTACLALMVTLAVALVYGRTSAAPPPTSQEVSPATSSTNAVHYPAGAGQATPVDDSKPIMDRKSPNGQRDRRDTSQEKQSSGRSSPTKANPVRNVSSPTFGNAANRYQAGLTDPGAAQKGGSIRAHGVFPKSLLLPNNVRHRSPNPAIVGGLANAKVRNAGTIDGTQMRRKP
jgi:hypothetical protein